MQHRVPYTFRSKERFQTDKDFCTTITQRIDAIVSSVLDLTTTEMENPAKIIIEYSTSARIRHSIEDETYLTILESWENNWIRFPAVLVTVLFKNPLQAQEIISSLLKKPIFGSISFDVCPTCEADQKQKIASHIATYFRSSPNLYFIYFENFSNFDIDFIEIFESLKYVLNLEIIELVELNPKENDFGIPLGKSLTCLKKLREFHLYHCDVWNENLIQILKSLNFMNQTFHFLDFRESWEEDSDSELWELFEELEKKSEFFEYQ